MAKGLGKGLNAFFPEEKVDENNVQDIKIKDLRPNPYQPRKFFSDEGMEELVESIREHGIVQPLIVRESIKGYEIVVGERRFRAAEKIGLKTVPAIVKELTDEKMMEIALIENLQREDLNPLEEARAYDKLMNHLNITQEQLAKRLGKSRPHIANHVRLLQLPKVVQELVSDGKLSMGHGRALLGLKKKEKIAPVVEKVVKEQLNVRQLEQLIQHLNEHVPRETKKKTEKPSVFIQAKEEHLRERLGTSVSIKKGKKKGKIEIEFMTEEDLERILSVIEGENNDA